MKSQLEAFSVKIDKVPTLVDKIVSDSQNQSSAEPDPAITQIPDNLDDIKTNLSEKIKGLEELIVQTPLLPEPDPAIAQMARYSFHTRVNCFPNQASKGDPKFS